jgi:flavin reductase (DIM6/NTAB) family NADH-FMN oxidoreductase RutF
LTEAGENVSLCALSEGNAEALTYFGTHSGREGNKFAATGLTPLTMPCGGVGVREARLVITARKVYSHAMQEGEFSDLSLISRWYAREGFHTLYMAAVRGIYLAE